MGRTDLKRKLGKSSNTDYRTEPTRKKSRNSISHTPSCSCVIKIRGLSYNCTALQIVSFFERRPRHDVARVYHGVDGVVLNTTSSSRSLRQAFVVFESEQYRRKALEKDGQYLGDRFIELSPSTWAEFQKAAALNNAMIHSKSPSTSKSEEVSNVSLSKTNRTRDTLAESERIIKKVRYHFIKLHGLPYEAQSKDICKFLWNFRSRMQRRIHMMYNEEGPSGDAFVEMDSEKAAKAAVKECNLTYMYVNGKTRFIKLSQCSSKEMDNFIEADGNWVKFKYVSTSDNGDDDAASFDSTNLKNSTSSNDEESDNESVSSESSNESIVCLGSVDNQKSLNNQVPVDSDADENDNDIKLIAKQLIHEHHVSQTAITTMEANIVTDLLHELNEQTLTGNVSDEQNSVEYQDFAHDSLLGSTPSTIDRESANILVIVGIPLWELNGVGYSINNTTQLMKNVSVEMGMDPHQLVSANLGDNVNTGELDITTVELCFSNRNSMLMFWGRYVCYKETNPFLKNSYCQRNFDTRKQICSTNDSQVWL